MTDKETIWQFLKSAGLSNAGVAGLMGNLEAESGFNPKNLEDSFEEKLGFTDETYTTAIDEGEYDHFSNDGAGYGLAQWSYHTKKLALLSYSKIKDESIGNLNLQLGFLKKDMEKYFSKLWNFLKTTDSIYEATVEVLTKYEAPTDQSDSVKDKRYELAKAIYNEFVGEEEKIKKVEDEIKIEETKFDEEEIELDDNSIVDIIEPEENEEEIKEESKPKSEFAPPSITPNPIKINNNPQYVNGIATEIVNGIWGNEWKEPVTSKIKDVVEGIRATAGASEQYYKVVAGDTLTKIANRFGTTVEKIIHDNSTIYPTIVKSYLSVGWVLKV